MSSTQFTDKVTMVPADWANAVNALTYDVFGGATSVSDALAAIGLSSIASQVFNAAVVTGGNINNTPIGQATPSVGAFTTLTATKLIPTNPGDVATKQYTDQMFAQIIDMILSDELIYELLATKVNKSGDTMTGPLVLNTLTPTDALHAAPKDYVDVATATVNTALTTFITSLANNVDTAQGAALVGYRSWTVQEALDSILNDPVATSMVYAGPANVGGNNPSLAQFRLLVRSDLSFAGQANGVATLDATGRVPAAQMPVGTGTVTSIGLSMPSTFTVTGSPVTGAGTITVGLAAQAPNLFLAGPVNGANAAPSFRAMQPADLPLATVSTVGGVSVGSGLSVTAGVLSLNAASLVTSFNTRTGAVTLQGSDITSAGGALLASPAFTGTPTVPTATLGTNNTQAASVAYVYAATQSTASIALSSGNVTATAAQYSAPVLILTGTLTGNASVTLPTAGSWHVLNNTTGAFTTTLSNGSGATVTIPQGSLLGVASVGSTGVLSVSISGGTVTSFNTRTGAVSLTITDVTNAGGAPLASPTFTGTPSGPTAAATTNTTQFATTAFVQRDAKLIADAGDSYTCVVNLKGTSNGTSVSFTFDRIRVKNAAGALQWITPAGGITITPTSVGANGRESASNLTSSWGHAYAIWGSATGNTLAGVISASATAPTLPSGYTDWAYLGPLRFGSTANVPVICRYAGDEVWYRQGDLYTVWSAVATSSTQTMTNWTVYFPPNAFHCEFSGVMTVTGDTNGNAVGVINIVLPGDSQASIILNPRLTGIQVGNTQNIPVHEALVFVPTLGAPVIYGQENTVGALPSLYVYARMFRFTGNNAI